MNEYVGNKLREAIVNKYESIRKFSKVTEITYSTIASILKMGVDGTSFQTVMKICEYLDLDAYKLYEGEVEYKKCKKEELTEFNRAELDILDIIHEYDVSMEDVKNTLDFIKNMKNK